MLYIPKSHNLFLPSLEATLYRGILLTNRDLSDMNFSRSKKTSIQRGAAICRKKTRTPGTPADVRTNRPHRFARRHTSGWVWDVTGEAEKVMRILMSKALQE